MSRNDEFDTVDFKTCTRCGGGPLMVNHAQVCQECIEKPNDKEGVRGE